MSAIPFAARLVAVMVAVVLAASVLTVSVNYLKFRRVLRAQEDLVYHFVGNDLASTIEDSMNLGLPLAALQTTDQLIQRRRAAETGTAGITVFDAAGTVLFDTDRFRVGSRLPAFWKPLALPPDGTWQGEIEGANLVGATIINSFGQPAGGLVVRYDPAPLEARLNVILLEMTEAAIGMVALCAALAVAAAAWLTRGHNAWFNAATAQISAQGGPPATSPAAGSEALMASVRRTGDALDDAEAELIRLGSADEEPARAA